MIAMLLFSLLLLAALPVSAQVSLSDIETNWAKEHIESLVSKGIVNGYPDKTFRPDRPVTRAEFAKMMTAAFTFEESRAVSFKDIASHWARRPILTLAEAEVVEGYPDGTFKPDNHITRAEVVSMLVRTLKLHDVKGYTQTPSFTDVSTSHWAFANIETALRLKILPPYVRGEFRPTYAANRAETAAMIDSAMQLQMTRGTLDYLEANTRTLGVRTDAGPRDFTLMADTVVFRNTSTVPLENVVVGDAVYVVADRFGSPQFVKTNGVITQQDVASKVTGITRGLLSPNDLRYIIQGDWAALGDSLKSNIYDELVERGVTPVEAGAIMSQDWASLQVYGRDRLAQVIASQLGVTTDLAFALLEQDWEQARELAQAEAVQQLLGQFLLEENV